MGRISHCNIFANRRAYERVYNHGFSIVERNWRNLLENHDVAELTIFNSSDKPLTTCRFNDYDEEVRLNTQTEWLNKVADELDYWQSKS